MMKEEKALEEEFEGTLNEIRPYCLMVQKIALYETKSVSERKWRYAVSYACGDCFH